MLTRIRLKLAAWLIPRTFHALSTVIVGCSMLALRKWLAVHPDSDMLIWHYYIDDVEYQIQLSWKDTRTKLQCEVCTNVFEADPDMIVKCPECGSSNVVLTGGNK